MSDLKSLRPGYNQKSPGRVPTKYTKGLHENIVNLIKEGNRPEVAAIASGITADTFHNWLAQGRSGEIALWQFAADVDRAVAEAEVAAVKIVQQSATVLNPENAKWWLERGRSQGWSKQLQMLVKGELDSVMEKLREGLPPDLYLKVISVIAGESDQLSSETSSSGTGEAAPPTEH
jgi:hypothetical protein